MKNHYFLPGGRTSVLVTSSTLNDYWGRKSGVPYVGDDLHLDVISVPGARLRDLNRAYRAEYSTHPLPVDCLVVAGFNDILNSQLDRAELGTHPEELEQLMQEATTRLTEDARALKQAVLNAQPPTSPTAWLSPPCQFRPALGGLTEPTAFELGSRTLSGIRKSRCWAATTR